MSHNSQHQSSTIMDYLTSAGYEVQYKLGSLRKPLGSEKEYSVLVQLGDEIFEGTSGNSFAISEERLLLGVLRALKEKLESEKRQREVEASRRESHQEQVELDEIAEQESRRSRTQVSQEEAF